MQETELRFDTQLWEYNLTGNATVATQKQGSSPFVRPKGAYFLKNIVHKSTTKHK